MVSRIALGTVQIGTRYGVANAVGFPTEEAALQLLSDAVRDGVVVLDSARAYGDSERRIGMFLQTPHKRDVRVVSKLSPLGFLDTGTSLASVRSAVEASVLRSLYELQVRKLDTLLLHRWHHWSSFEGVIRETLLSLKGEGLIEHLGASLSTPAEFLDAVRFPEIEVLQIPCNIVDWRWRSPEVSSMLSGCNREIMVRSVYLQGLLVVGPEKWPVIENCVPAEICKKLDELVKRLKRKNRADLCLAYMAAQSWAKFLIVGAESAAQIRETVKLAENSALSSIECKFVESELPVVPECLLNPAQWPSR